VEQESNDIILFRQVKSDDRLALNTLFARYYQKLCGFATTYIRQADEAEEVVSDVFVTLWKNRHHLVIEKNLKAYLYVSVRHAALAVIKKRQPLFEDIEDILFENSHPDFHTPEQSLLHKELQQYINDTVDALPSRCKQVFLMSRVDELTYREISEILEISENTVENHLVKALSVLRDSLKRYHHTEHHPRALTEA
jgi:RNA polymerase sigma-70 factor (ECF subfamily)